MRLWAERERSGKGEVRPKEYKGPTKPYLPEVAVGANLQKCAEIVVEAVDMGRSTIGTDMVALFAKRPSITTSELIGYPVDKERDEATLRKIERDLEPYIAFDEAQAGHSLDPQFPRSTILVRALFAESIENTTKEGLIEAALDLIRNPALIDRADGTVPLDKLRNKFKSVYGIKQFAARARVAKSGDKEAIQRYVALDTLFRLTQYELYFHRSAMEQENNGRGTMLTTAEQLTRRVFKDLDAVANGINYRPIGTDNRMPTITFPEQLGDQVRNAVGNKTGRERESALFDLALRFVRPSIIPLAHTFMDLKLLGFSLLDKQKYVDRLRPTVYANGKIIWVGESADERAKGPSNPSLGGIDEVRRIASEDVLTRCPARRPFSGDTVPTKMRESFEDVGRRFQSSPADALLHITLELYRAYIQYRFNKDQGIKHMWRLLDSSI